MNVLIINQNIYVPSNTSGVRHFELARELQKRGHEVLMVSGGFDHNKKIETKTYDSRGMVEEIIEGVPFIWLKTMAYKKSGLKRLLGMFHFYFLCRKIILRHCSFKPDAVIGSSPPPLAALSAAHIARRKSLPFVLELRDIWPQTLADIGGVSPVNPVYLFFLAVEKRLYTQAGGIISTLPNAGAHIEKVIGYKPPVYYIPNGARFDQDCQSSCNEVENENADLNSYFSVVYAGALGRSNDIETIITAALEIGDDLSFEGKPVRFFLYGQGEDLARLKDMAMKLGLDNIEFREPVPKHAVQSLLTSASCLVLSVKKARIYDYGISMNKLNDYFAAKKPVVISVKAYNDPVKESGAGISVAPEDGRAMAQAIRKLALLPREKRDEMGLKGWEFARERHDFTRLGQDLENALLDICQVGKKEDLKNRRGENQKKGK